MSEPFIAPEGAMQFEVERLDVSEDGPICLVDLAEPFVCWVLAVEERCSTCGAGPIYRAIFETLPKKYQDEWRSSPNNISFHCAGHLIE